jgi:hypothetical protein
MTLRPVAALLALSLTACAAEDFGDAEGAIFEGTPEAIGVLRFLNGPAADLETLDVDAALDARAARNIVTHVRGADGVLGTADDQLLASIEQLDAIAYVGPSTIDKLLAYVESIGGVPRIDADGVMLTEAEAAAIVAAAGGATEAELDVDADLDSRAARNLVAARPLADIGAVAAVPYVGASAIEKLRRWAPGWEAPTSEIECVPALRAGMRECVDAQLVDAPMSIDDAIAICTDAEAVGPVFDEICAGPLGAPFCDLAYEQFFTIHVPPCADALAAELAPLCLSNADCLSPERCMGMVNDGSSVLGRCANTTAPEGYSDLCDAQDECGAGLVCTGLIGYGWGQCLMAWMSGSFTMDVPTYLSGTAGSSVTTQTTVLGLASVAVDVEVEIDLGGIDASRLRITLTDKHDNTGELWNGPVDGSTLPARLVPRGGISGDQSINGTWKLTVTTVGGGAAGRLDGWTLHLTSRWD